MTLKQALAVPTYRNTEFMVWWKMFNEECVKLGLPEQGFGVAHGSYEVGETPQTAASYLEGYQ